MRVPEAMLAESIRDRTVENLRRLEAGGRHVAEVKYDGMRARAVVKDGRLTGLFARESLVTQHGRFPELVGALAGAVPPSGTYVLDGEVGSLDVTGLKMDVDVLQHRARTNHIRVKIHATHSPMTFVAFDVLHVDGSDVCATPYQERAALLRRLVCPNERVQLAACSPRLVELYEEICAAGGEGVVVKDVGSAYLPGLRSSAWLKAKAPNFVDSLHVVGLVQGEGSRATSFGAFILARETVRGLEYVCKAGSGLSQEALVRVMDATPRLQRRGSPLFATPRFDKPVLMWLECGVQADVRYDAPTKRSPRFPRVVSVRIVGDA